MGRAAPPETAPNLFERGDKMEVRVQNDAVVWCPATYVGFTTTRKILVQFEDKSTESVRPGDVRPAPPPELHRYLKVGEMVEGFCRDKKGWRKGHVVEILENSKYTVSFDGYVTEMEHWELRVFREWADGCWDPPLPLQQVLQVDLNDLPLKRKRCEKALEPLFGDETLVEVKSDEEGYQGSWYTAIVVCLLCSESDTYLVQYQTMKAENESGLLFEKVSALNIRPCPPALVRVDRFRKLEKVDAWYNDGWWVGLVSKVLDGFKYAVYFWPTNEELIFEHSSMRPHQEWIDGKWVVSAVVEDKTGADHFLMSGVRVEVKSDTQGYRGSWYPAVIVKPLGNRKYLVEYLTLKTDDGTQLHREEAEAACIRPCPSVDQRKHPYKALEEVDAWYNEGWWVGKIHQVLEGRKYTVYFNTTNEILEFQHSELRPYRDWVDGRWIISKREDKTGADHFLMSGVRVEVKSDTQGYIGSWYPAVIVKPLGNRNYLVKYLTLKTDDGTQLHREEAEAACIRPCPSVDQRKHPYKALEEVDAWYNEGWWVGKIYQVLEGRKYTVYFNTTNEILEFQHSKLRPHRDWVDGQWISAKRGHPRSSLKRD